MAYKAPGKAYRKGITAKQFYRMFPDDETAERWFIAQRWPDGIHCPRCGSDNVQVDAKHPTMPFRCRKSVKRGSCGKYFSAKTETFMDSANIGYQDWLSRKARRRNQQLNRARGTVRRFDRKIKT